MTTVVNKWVLFSCLLAHHIRQSRERSGRFTNQYFTGPGLDKQEASADNDANDDDNLSDNKASSSDDDVLLGKRNRCLNVGDSDEERT